MRPSCSWRTSSVIFSLATARSKVRVDACTTCFGAGRVRLVERDVVPGRGKYLRDAVAHEARAAHNDVPFGHVAAKISRASIFEISN